MTTSTPTGSARNDFLDALYGIAALLTNARVNQASLLTVDSGCQSVSDVEKIT